MMALDIYALGNRIKIIRKDRGLSQSELSELVDKTPTYISLIENGSKCMSLSTFVDLANALGAPADDLLLDSLCEISAVCNKAYAAILSDCEPYEQRLLLAVLSSAKEALKAHKDYLLW